MQRMAGGRFGPLPLPPPTPPSPLPLPLPLPPTPSQCTTVYAKEQFYLFYIIYDVLCSESTFYT